MDINDEINDKSTASIVGVENEVENGRTIPIFENVGEDEPIPRGLIQREKVGGFQSLALEIYKVVFDVHQVEDGDVVSALNPLPGFSISCSNFGGEYLGSLMPWIFFFGKRVDMITISANDEPFMQEIQIKGII